MIASPPRFHFIRGPVLQKMKPIPDPLLQSRSSSQSRARIADDANRFRVEANPWQTFVCASVRLVERGNLTREDQWKRGEIGDTDR